MNMTSLRSISSGFLLHCILLIHMLPFTPTQAWIAPNALSYPLSLPPVTAWSALLPRATDVTNWLRRFRSPSALYRQLLEEQKNLLERQLRQTKEELFLLRNQYQTLQRSK